MRNHKIGFYLFSILMFCSCMLKAEKFVLTMNWTPQAEFAGYYVAKEKGFYKEAGLDVEMHYHSLSASVHYRMDTDECDAGLFSLMAAIDIIASGKPLVNIFQTSMNSSYIIVSRWGKNPLTQKRDRLAVYMSEPNYLSFILDRKQKMDYEWVFYTGNINVFLSGGVDAMTMVSYSEYLQLKQAGFDMPEESLLRSKDNGYNLQENGV